MQSWYRIHRLHEIQQTIFRTISGATFRIHFALAFAFAIAFFTNPHSRWFRTCARIHLLFAFAFALVFALAALFFDFPTFSFLI